MDEICFNGCQATKRITKEVRMTKMETIFKIDEEAYLCVIRTTITISHCNITQDLNLGKWLKSLPWPSYYAAAFTAVQCYNPNVVIDSSFSRFIHKWKSFSCRSFDFLVKKMLNRISNACETKLKKKNKKIEKKERKKDWETLWDKHVLQLWSFGERWLLLQLSVLIVRCIIKHQKNILKAVSNNNTS